MATTAAAASRHRITWRDTELLRSQFGEAVILTHCWFVGIMCGRNLLGVEGFPVNVRLNPDRLSQRTALTAVDRGARELHLEMLDSLESGVRIWALHGVSVPAHAHQVLFRKAHTSSSVTRPANTGS